jgi:hypothetical protein
MKKADKEQATRKVDVVVLGSGTLVPIPEGATEDDVTEMIVSHPEMVARGEAARRRQVALLAEMAASREATNDGAPADEAAATAVEAAAP